MPGLWGKRKSEIPQEKESKNYTSGTFRIGTLRSKNTPLGGGGLTEVALEGGRSKKKGGGERPTQWGKWARVYPRVFSHGGGAWGGNPWMTNYPGGPDINFLLKERL